MISNTVPSNSSKNVNSNLQVPSSSQTQSIPSLGIESHPQRRSGGSGTFGAGSASRIPSGAARNSQSLRKQHKGQRRPKLADDDATAESSSKSRKGQTSITHLMSFALPPRPYMNPQSHYNRHVRRNPTWGLGSGYHATDKAKYVHANYRFIVDPRGDYSAQAMDADVHLDWTSILQVLVSAQSQAANCPICLSKPVAPRMAKCGHVFCLPCLIRYIHSTDDTNPIPEKRARWKKCPICWDGVYMSETRPVRWFAGQEGDAPREGEDVVLRLITRQAGSTLALPRDGAESLDKADEIPWYFAAEVIDYARVMKGSEDYMVAQHDHEIKELRYQEREDELLFGEDTMWTRKAVSAVLEAQEKLRGIGNPPSTTKQSNEKNSVRKLSKSHQSDESNSNSRVSQHTLRIDQSVSEVCAVTQSWGHTLHLNESKTDLIWGIDEVSEVLPTRRTVPCIEQTPLKDQATAAERHSLTQEKSSAASQPHDYDSRFFFYEALLHYYLSPLDIRILKAAFGEFSAFPTTVLPRVERVSTGHIVDNELRRRAKYLAHLPYGCEVGFLECDWTDIVGPEILDDFSIEIERRRKKNREKETREEKERVRAEKEEDDKRWATARRKRPAITEDIIADTDFQPLPTTQGRHVASTIDAMADSSPPWKSSRVHSGSAFASLASPSTSPVAARTVWGTTVIPVSPPLTAESIDTEPREDDGWLQDWEKDLLKEDDLVSQFEAASLGQSIFKEGTAGPINKRRKHKKITLMTTNARRGA